MPDLGAHIPDSGGDCEGCPRDINGDPIPWPCHWGWRLLRRQYRGQVVVLEWDLLLYLAGQLVWTGQRMPYSDAGDIATRVIRHLEPQTQPLPQRTPGAVYGNSRWSQ